MAGTHSHEESVKLVWRGFTILLLVTLGEVGVALFGGGHIFESIKAQGAGLWALRLVMIGLSLFKAYYIISEFMHMRYEMRALAMTVLLPTLLLVWAVIAFLNEGNYWSERREQIQEFNNIQGAAPSAAAATIDTAATRATKDTANNAGANKPAKDTAKKK